jgi:hypothetical protein
VVHLGKGDVVVLVELHGLDVEHGVLGRGVEAGVVEKVFHAVEEGDVVRVGGGVGVDGEEGVVSGFDGEHGGELVLRL